MHRLRVAGSRPARLSVPARRLRRAPLIVYFHGAGASPEAGIRNMRGLADTRGALVLAPASREPTWDLSARGGFGADLAALDRLLRRVSRRVAIDPRRVMLAGGSDGATYALSLGLTNGDLVRGIAAFSPGYAAPAARRGRPPVFVSHGTRDRVLPIDRTSRELVPRLRDQGYRVVYREFDGGHVVPPEMARRAVQRFLGPG